MGVRGLFTYCNRIKHYTNTNLTNLRIGLDGFSLIFLFREDREAFADYLRHLLSAKHTLVLIMDKRAQKEKREVVEERKEQRKEAKAEASTLISFTKTAGFEELDSKQQFILEKLLAQKERAAWCLYSEYVKWFCSLLQTLGITIVWAEEEADTLLAKGDYDVVISSDSDILILGARKLWIPEVKYTKLNTTPIFCHKEIDGKEFLQYIGLSGEQLFEMAYMAGCDVQPHSLMPIKEAISRLRFYGTIENIHKKHPELINSEHLEKYDKLRRDVWTK